MQNYICPHCEYRFALSARYTGTKMTCPACGQSVVVPAARPDRLPVPPMPPLEAPASPPPQPGPPPLPGQLAQPSRTSAAKTPALVVASLVFAVLSFMCFGPIFSIPAVITGHIAYARTKRSPETKTSSSLALGAFVMGYVNISLFVAIGILASFIIPLLSRIGEAKMRSRCIDNLKQISTAFKMYASEQPDYRFPPLSSEPGLLMCETGSIYPQYLSNPLKMLCEYYLCSGDEYDFGDSKVRLCDDSYFYLGYVLGADSDVLIFADLYKRRMAAGLSMKEDLPAGDGTLVLLREGIEKFLITDINDPGAASAVRSSIPIIIERPEKHRGEGGYVLYMDGRIEFVRFPGKWPMTEITIGALKELDGVQYMR